MVGQTIESVPYTSQIVYTCLEQLWSDEKNWAQYVQAMQQALLLDAAPEPGLSLSFLHLAGLCCQAAGGEPQQAVNVAVAWALLYTAAHLLDNVEDGEAVGQVASTAINTATGLIFTGIRALSVPWAASVSDRVRIAIIEDFARTALQMGCGQHVDLVGSASSLDQCWKMVEAKSGACFALACRAGAMLAGATADVVEGCSQFGHHLGMVIQIADDLQGIRASNGERSDIIAGKRGLPVWYTLSVLSSEAREHFSQCLQAAPYDPAAEMLALNLIEKSGAALYLEVKAHHHRLQALACLRKFDLVAAPCAQLVYLLNKSCPGSRGQG